jgi:ATP-dependent exoDNAse (exonuclease V) beta subunit
MGDDALARLASAQGRVLGATSEEVSAAHETVRRVMQHPVMQHAADAEKKGLCYRETPVTWRLSDRALVEGYVDLAYVVGDEVVVVEFKTDRELAGALETYRRQVQIYGAAVGSALGRRPRAVLMRV